METILSVGETLVDGPSKMTCAVVPACALPTELESDLSRLIPGKSYQEDDGTEQRDDYESVQVDIGKTRFRSLIQRSSFHTPVATTTDTCSHEGSYISTFDLRDQLLTNSSSVLTGDAIDSFADTDDPNNSEDRKLRDDEGNIIHRTDDNEDGPGQHFDFQLNDAGHLIEKVVDVGKEDSEHDGSLLELQRDPSHVSECGQEVELDRNHTFASERKNHHRMLQAETRAPSPSAKPAKKNTRSAPKMTRKTPSQAGIITISSESICPESIGTYASKATRLTNISADTHSTQVVNNTKRAADARRSIAALVEKNTDNTNGAKIMPHSHQKETGDTNTKDTKAAKDRKPTSFSLSPRKMKFFRKKETKPQQTKSKEVVPKKEKKSRQTKPKETLQKKEKKPQQPKQKKILQKNEKKPQQPKPKQILQKKEKKPQQNKTGGILQNPKYGKKIAPRTTYPKRLQTKGGTTEGSRGGALRGSIGGSAGGSRRGNAVTADYIASRRMNAGSKRSAASVATAPTIQTVTPNRGINVFPKRTAASVAAPSVRFENPSTQMNAAPKTVAASAAANPSVQTETPSRRVNVSPKMVAASTTAPGVQTETPNRRINQAPETTAASAATPSLQTETTMQKDVPADAVMVFPESEAPMQQTVLAETLPVFPASNQEATHSPRPSIKSSSLMDDDDDDDDDSNFSLASKDSTATTNETNVAKIKTTAVRNDELTLMAGATTPQSLIDKRNLLEKAADTAYDATFDVMKCCYGDTMHDVTRDGFVDLVGGNRAMKAPGDEKGEYDASTIDASTVDVSTVYDDYDGFSGYDSQEERALDKADELEGMKDWNESKKDANTLGGFHSDLYDIGSVEETDARNAKQRGRAKGTNETDATAGNADLEEVEMDLCLYNDMNEQCWISPISAATKTITEDYNSTIDIASSDESNPHEKTASVAVTNSTAQFSQVASPLTSPRVLSPKSKKRFGLRVRKEGSVTKNVIKDCDSIIDIASSDESDPDGKTALVAVTNSTVQCSQVKKGFGSRVRSFKRNNRKKVDGILDEDVLADILDEISRMGPRSSDDVDCDLPQNFDDLIATAIAEESVATAIAEMPK